MDDRCPYCNEVVEICHDDGYGYDESGKYNQECGHCGKTFVFETYITISHTLSEAPCLNGEPHDLQPIRGFPDVYYNQLRRCSCCGEEVILDKEVHYQNIKKYVDSLKSKRGC